MVKSFSCASIRRWRVAVLYSAALLLSSCGQISGSITALLGSTANDFKRSEIMSNGPGVADGQTELLLIVHLINSDGSKVKRFTPNFQVISGTGVVASACTSSNDNGVSTCVLKATQAGVKRISITNIEIELEADLVFNAPSPKPVVGLISDARKQVSGTYTLSASVGTQEPGVVKTSGTYKLYGGVQGEAFSR